MKNELHFFSGKMASGKSTLSKLLAKKYKAILLNEDELLSSLYPYEINTIEDYVKYSNRLKSTLQKHIENLLLNNIVILDFPANTKKQRLWFKSIIENTNIIHTLHYLNKSDKLCKKQLKIRNIDKSIDAPFTTDIEFDMITKYFQEPSSDEGFNIKIYKEEK